MVARKLKAISLYTGIGGLDFGFEAAGFEIAAAVEMDTASCRALRLNRSRWPLLEGDIHQIASEAILERAELGPGEADVVIGGPPWIAGLRGVRVGQKSVHGRERRRHRRVSGRPSLLADREGGSQEAEELCP